MKGIQKIELSATVAVNPFLAAANARMADEIARGLPEALLHASGQSLYAYEVDVRLAHPNSLKVYIAADADVEVEVGEPGDGSAPAIPPHVEWAFRNAQELRPVLHRALRSLGISGLRELSIDGAVLEPEESVLEGALREDEDREA